MPVKLKYGSNRPQQTRISLRSPGRPHCAFGAARPARHSGRLSAVVFGYFYYHYQHVVDDRLAAGPMFASVSQIYAAPREVRTGQKLTAAEIAADLRRAGYNANPQLGTYQLNGDNILIKPGPESYHTTDGATINTTDGVVQSITAENGVALSAYQLEPQLITALSEDKNRTKRRLVTYKEIPAAYGASRHRHRRPRLLPARRRQLSPHHQVRLFRTSLLDHRRCGGSTLTHAARARLLPLAGEAASSASSIEIMITFQLESRFNKQQIFEMYANQINLGQRGSYAINGFGEAAQAFFGKTCSNSTSPSAPCWPACIQSPNATAIPTAIPNAPWPAATLSSTPWSRPAPSPPAEAERAKAEPLRLAPPNIDASEAPYFVDLVHDQLVQRIGDQDLAHQSLRIYTSLDPELQRAASEAVEIGMKNVDEIVRKQHKTPKGEQPGPITYPQVALVAINPHTGQILALVGGRNYGASQLNHAVSKRPTGSIFKPFVYAAAYNSSPQRPLAQPRARQRRLHRAHPAQR